MAYLRDPNCITPIMTSSTSPSGVVTASYNYGSTYDMFRVLDGDLTAGYGWFANAATGVDQWIAYEFATAQRVDYYNIYHFPDDYCVFEALSGWRLEGWNGSSWVVLDTRSGHGSWTSGVGEKFTISSPQEFIKYRLYCTAVYNNNRLMIGELELCASLATPQYSYAI